MNCRFSQVLESRKQNRALKLAAYFILLVFALTTLVSCKMHYKREAEPNSILVLPAYHLASYRSEFAYLFYETDEHSSLG